VKHVLRMFAALTAVVALGVGTGVALADHGSGGGAGGRGDSDGKAQHGQAGKGDDHAAKEDHKGKKDDEDADAVEVYMLDGGATHGNPEGVAFDKRSGDFFVSATGDGSIWRGELGNTADLVPTFIPGVAGNSATGMKIAKGMLFVSGAGTGTIKVYEVDSGALLATFDTTGGSTAPTFVNDLVVTRHGDVVATDSFRPALYRLSADEIEAGIAAGTPTVAIPIDPADVITTTPEIPFNDTPGTFNLNGIVASKGHGHRDEVIVVNSETGQLFRVRIDERAPADREIDELVVDGGPFPGGDGLLIDRGRLLVVQGSTPDFPNGVVDFIKLRHGHRAGELDDQRTDASLRGPSTIARARDEYLIVNADFAQSRTPFTVTGLPR
jgi:sugar lactone lactonase YvrE